MADEDQDRRDAEDKARREKDKQDRETDERRRKQDADVAIWIPTFNS